MKVLMMMDGLVFEAMTQEQETEVLKAVENARVKETAKGLKVQGSAEILYKALYELSYKFDLELV